MKPPFALVDCNSFYASCERVFRPDLWNRPVAVLSNNDGCVIAASSEVKEAGIRMMAPYFEAKHDLERIGATVFSSNYALYGDLSRRVMSVLEEMAPAMEVYSIDEAFLSLFGIPDPEAFVREIRSRIQGWIGLPVTIGIGSTKTLAKVAQRLAKKDPRGKGFFMLPEDEKELDRILASVSTIQLWGISTARAEKLRSVGIHTARDLKYGSDSVIRSATTLHGLRTAQELRGIPALPMELAPSPKKSITVSRMFGHPVTDLRELEEAISTYASRAMEKLRKDHQTVSSVRVYVVASGGGERKEHLSVSITLRKETNNTSMVIKQALTGLHSIYQEGRRYKKAGIFLEGLTGDACIQDELFPQEDGDRSQRLMDMMDSTNRRFGTGRLFYGSQGTGRGWSMKQELMSPRYTTSIEELPLVLAK